MRSTILKSPVFLVSLLALVAVCLQLPGGVRTDEAKYLLSIPYPHPPLIRTIISWTATLPFSDVLWRCIFAFLTLHAGWLVWDMGAVLQREKRVTLTLTWLLSSAVLLQAGSIMLVVPTALFGLLCVWLLHSHTEDHSWNAAAMGLLWISALMSAYQTILFFPLVIALLRRTSDTKFRKVLAFCLPIALLALYTLSNPLALATMLKVTGQDAPLPILARLTNVLWIWLLAGGMLSVVGTVGIFLSERASIIASFILICLYIALTAQHYYAILLTPLLLAGLHTLFARRKLKPSPFLLLHAVLSLILVCMSLPQMFPTPARSVASLLTHQGVQGTILIDGHFGHEWQYESRLPIRRFTQELSSDVESQAAAIVCMKKSCDDDIDTNLWVRLKNPYAETWVRR